MSTAPVPAWHAPRAARSAPVWLESRAMWSGLAIVVMWLAVLFVGLFGPDIHGADGSVVPSAVALALFALIATLVLARGLRPDVDELRRALDDERDARIQLAAEVAELRSRPPR